MPKFYREAILAAHCVEGTAPAVNIGPLETWPEVVDALNKLGPAARCHAIYADWLLQLDEPGGDVQIQIRDLLLGQGALAANYLGEMAQNADDSGASSLLVALEGDWLLVANNGRALSSLNLLGLCRFFVHSNGQVVGLTPETIGKFGIGFKSCHRVADEVFVWSWGMQEEYGFRLPISQGGGEIAKPDPAKLALLLDYLKKAGKPLANVRPDVQLGHCTPEALEGRPEALPAALVQRIEGFKRSHSEKGVWFALHLHERGRKEAEKRIIEQADALYELCPLFLNHLRNVSLQDRSLRLALGNSIGQNVGDAEARRITLEVTNSDGTKRNDRLLLLSSSVDKTWKLALPADSEFKIKRPTADQFSLRNGGGYAFLPLPSLIWPWHVHFHLNAPTNLARSDWNPADAEDTHAHIRDASAKLAGWTSSNANLWHPTWQPADILTRDPSGIAPDSSARVFADAYQESLCATDSLRTLWGAFTSPENAVGLRLEPGQVVTDAWLKIAEFVPAPVQQQYPLVLLDGGAVHLDLPMLTTEKAKRVFTALREANHDAPFWQEYVQAVLGTDADVSGGYSRSEMIENALGPVPLSRPVDAPITIETASESRFAVRLTDEWHERFRYISANWLGPNWSLASQAVFGIRVSQMLRSLSSAAETPTGWDEVSRMTEGDFRRAGDAFWSAQRPACPPALTDAVIRAIWVECGRDWVPLAEVWLGGESVAMLKGVVRALERRPGELNDQRRRRMSDALTLWRMKQDYEGIIEGRIEELAENEFYRRLKEDNPANPNRLQMLPLAVNWNPQNLPPSWRENVVNAAKKAVIRLFRDSGCEAHRGKTLLVGKGAVQKLMCRLPAFVESPTWLEPEAIRWLEDNGITGNLNVSIRLLSGLNRDQKEEFGRALLAGFRHWSDEPVGQMQFALQDFFADTTGNWIVGYAGGADKLLKDHFAWVQPAAPANTTEWVDCVLAGAKDRDLEGGNFLPIALAAVPELRNKCVQVSDLKHEVISPDDDDDSVLSEGQIHENMIQNPWFERLRQLRPNAKIVSLAGHQRLKWKGSGMEMTVSKAEFGLCQFQGVEAIFIADLTRQVVREDGSRYREVLYAYKSVAPDDTAIATALNGHRSLAKIYREHRLKIKARLVQVHATEMGYEARHVMRELLQNAESAYASRSPGLLPERATFEISARAVENGASWNFEVLHCGRAFNEPDKTGRIRDDDIRRLCALGAPQNYTEEEVGKFNRGFKAVFQVTDEVHVTSGGYDFKIEDMLLLNPSEPAHDPSATDRSTRFAFKVEASKKAELLRDDNNGKPKPFEAIELVFMRYVDAVIVRIGEQAEKTFEVNREVTNGAWKKLTIREHEGPKQGSSSHYLVCQQRDATNQRVAVAIMLGTDGLPIQVPKSQRFLYRTFPLQQTADWFPFLMNADFITEKGRAGLLPKSENDAFIICALEMSLALIKTRINETAGCIPNWVAWVRALERRKLEEGATTVSTRRSSFEAALRTFDLWLSNHLPDGERLRPANEFVFPSRLMRGIQEDGHFAEVLEINDTNWIDGEVADALQPYGVLAGRSLQLREQVAFLIQKGRDKEELRRVIEQLQSQEFARDGLFQSEIEYALGLLAREQNNVYRELLNLFPDGFIEELEDEEIIQDLDVQLVYAAWNESEALSQFTLAGWMGNLVFPGLGNICEQDQADLLRRTQKKESKEAWYRLFCLGSLLGARAKPTTVRNFWEGSLASRGIFDESGGSQQLSAILDEISHRPFGDLDATGENAELWRRVFYDFQKLRLFFFEDDLAGAFMEHIQNVQEWDGAISFLKNGFRKGEIRWACSVGQSMTAPLFWIMRELRRIDLIETDRFDASCFYMNGPARRMAARIGWLEPDECRRAYSFQAVLELSQACHRQASQHQVFYDLPLQWYAHQNPR